MSTPAAGRREARVGVRLSSADTPASRHPGHDKEAE
jgi:hypothetical protein